MSQRLTGFSLAERIRQALRDRDMTITDLVHRLEKISPGKDRLRTGYRVVSGRTRDPTTSTIIDICQALVIEADELLGVSRPEVTPMRAVLDSPLGELFKQAQALSERDCWIIIRVIRAIRSQRRVGKP